MTERPTAPPPPNTREPIFEPDTTTIADVRAAEYASWAERDRQQEARITFLEARLAKARTDTQYSPNIQRTTGRIVDLESELWSTRDHLRATEHYLEVARADLVLAHKHIALMSRLAAARRWWQR